MKRGESLAAIAGVALLLVGAWLHVSPEHSVQEVTIAAAGCALPVRVFSPPITDVRSAAVVFHGFCANRTIMEAPGRWLADANLRVYLVDLPGHGDNSEPFRFAPAEECAGALLEELTARGEIVPQVTALVGHSMGGGIAIRLADRFPTAATIAISPGPGELPRRMPSNLLVVSAALDPPRLREAARELADAAAGERTAAADFAERRAFRLMNLPRATHTSLLWDTRVQDMVSFWIASALSEQPTSRATAKPLAAGLAGLMGSLLLFPAAASGVVRLARADASRAELKLGAAPAWPGVLLRWVLAALFAVAALWVWVPLKFVGLYDGPYLVSYVFVAGLALLGMLWNWRRRTERARHASPLPLGMNGRAVAAGAVLGLAAMLVFGWWLDRGLYDAWLNAPRWGQFALMLLFLAPYFLAEELALGAPEEKCRAEARRYMRFILLRGILGAVLLVPIFVLGGGPFVVLLLGLYLALFSLLQRMGTDAVRSRTRSPAAAAVFAAILASWLLAALLPLV